MLDIHHPGTGLESHHQQFHNSYGELLASSVPGRVRVARFKWTGAHVCIGDVRGRWGGPGAEDRRNGPLPRARVAAMSRGGGGGWVAAAAAAAAGTEGLDFCTRQIEI
ncbi:hypothetical protein WN51_01140 [Melipona quadrifasciata]|uniref:Uncharacterized protein n=1 Tax=Melipona quadrifasciata TaxID=166423 RepID=A0A0M9A0B2_9HYME|nr:hypothetical protein WN51_01140 [Melipona quadrifasciata]